MPQLNFLRDPQPEVIVLGVAMPGNPRTRWHMTCKVEDFDRRSIVDTHLMVPRSCEHADLGHVLREAYDAWFNGEPWGVVPTMERALMRYSRS